MIQNLTRKLYEYLELYSSHLNVVWVIFAHSLAGESHLKLHNVLDHYLHQTTHAKSSLLEKVMWQTTPNKYAKRCHLMLIFNKSTIDYIGQQRVCKKGIS